MTSAAVSAMVNWWVPDAGISHPGLDGAGPSTGLRVMKALLPVVLIRT